MSECNYGSLVHVHGGGGLGLGLGASHHHRPMPRARPSHYGHGQRQSQGPSSLSPAELEWRLANERKRTFTEWTHHLGRMSSESSKTSTSVGAPRRSRWGSPAGYAYNGLYKHMNSVEGQGRQQSQQQQNDWKYKNDPACLRASELFRQEQNRLRKRGLVPFPAAWEAQGEDKGGSEPFSSSSKSPPPSVFVSDAEIADIERCFVAADVTQDGYLSCQEFKNFMEYRGAPITHLEARKLLHRTDPVYHSFIDLDQIMFLVLSCGLSTQNERELSPDEFSHLIERVRSVTAMPPLPSVPQDFHGQGHFGKSASAGPNPSATVLEEPHELTGAISYFEDIASHVQLKQSQEERYHEYRRGLRRQREANAYTGASAKGSTATGSHADVNMNYYPPPPGWKNMVLHSQDPSSHLPPLNFQKLKGEWETTVAAPEEQQRRFQQENSLLSVNPNRSRLQAGIGTGTPDRKQGPEHEAEAESAPAADPMPLSKCREILRMSRSPAQSRSRSPSPSRDRDRDKPETNANANTRANADALQAGPSLSFATELRQVLQVYKARADGFTAEAAGKRILNPEARTGVSTISGSESPHIIFRNAKANAHADASSASIQSQISTTAHQN